MVWLWSLVTRGGGTWQWGLAVGPGGGLGPGGGAWWCGLVVGLGLDVSPRLSRGFLAPMRRLRGAALSGAVEVLLLGAAEPHRVRQSLS